MQLMQLLVNWHVGPLDTRYQAEYQQCVVSDGQRHLDLGLQPGAQNTTNRTNYSAAQHVRHLCCLTSSYVVQNSSDFLLIYKPWRRVQVHRARTLGCSCWSFCTNCLTRSNCLVKQFCPGVCAWSAYSRGYNYYHDVMSRRQPEST